MSLSIRVSYPYSWGRMSTDWLHSFCCPCLFRRHNLQPSWHQGLLDVRWLWVCLFGFSIFYHCTYRRQSDSVGRASWMSGRSFCCHGELRILSIVLGLFILKIVVMDSTRCCDHVLPNRRHERSFILRILDDLPSWRCHRLYHPDLPQLEFNSG